MAYEKPARRLVEQRGRRSAVSVLRIDTAELHRVYDNILQRAHSALTYKEIIFSTFSNQ